MAGAGKKTFTAGETLTASDVNSYLMEQSVMNFAGTAARASAIPTPTTGMTSYIGVTGTASIPQLETYTGSAWQTPYGMTLVANITLSAASAVNIENCFSAAYDNYRIELNVTATTGPGGSQFYLRTGSTNATSGYNSSLIYWSGAAATGANRSSTGFFSFANSPTDSMTATIFSPFKTTRTAWLAQANQGSLPGMDGGYNSNTTSYESLNFATGGTLTGTLKIYGLRNS
jgi:hypothetical protein